MTHDRYARVPWISAVLVLYLTSVLNYTDDESTMIYHGFVFLSYFMPLFGAILADSYWGKYKWVSDDDLRVVAQIGLPFTGTLLSRCYLPYLRFQDRGTAVDGVRNGQSHPHRSFDGVKFHAGRPKVRVLRDLMI